MIIQFSPWGHYVRFVSERTWTSGEASFTPDGQTDAISHDDWPDLQAYAPRGVLCVQDDDCNEFLVDHMRSIEVPDATSYWDGQDVKVPEWPEHWTAKCQRARQLADALTAFDEMLSMAPTDYFDSHALKVLDIFAGERMKNEFTQLRKDIADWQKSDEAKALDRLVSDDEET